MFGELSMDKHQSHDVEQRVKTIWGSVIDSKADLQQTIHKSYRPMQFQETAVDETDLIGVKTVQEAFQAPTDLNQPHLGQLSH